MSTVKAPISLRSFRRAAANALSAKDGASAKVLGATAILAAGVGVAVHAETTTSLPAVQVDAPKEKPRPAAAPAPVVHQAAKPRSARRPTVHTAARQGIVVPGAQTAARAGVSGAGAPGAAPANAVPADADPYADPAAPYKVNRLSSNKFTEPVLNTPRTITVLSKEVLEDKNATSLREIGRSTAGVTLGTGEGGNAFGDRFFIRGFDARNDVFVDGIRDPGVSIRENFYTEQVEILRGPGSSYAGRGTAGGAINIVTKQAGDRDFYDVNVQGSPSDQTKRVTVDVNKAISPLLDVRFNGLHQEANVSGRDYVIDDRDGASGSVVFKPLDNLRLTAEYTHVCMHGLPDFGVPYNRVANRPFTESLVPRDTYYGFVNRDFQKSGQDFGTFTAEYRYNENLVLSSKLRQERSVLNYIGTLAEVAEFSHVDRQPESTELLSGDEYARESDGSDAEI